MQDWSTQMRSAAKKHLPLENENYRERVYLHSGACP